MPRRVKRRRVRSRGGMLGVLFCKTFTPAESAFDTLERSLFSRFFRVSGSFSFHFAQSGRLFFVVVETNTKYLFSAKKGDAQLVALARQSEPAHRLTRHAVQVVESRCLEGGM